MKLRSGREEGGVNSRGQDVVRCALGGRLPASTKGINQWEENALKKTAGGLGGGRTGTSGRTALVHLCRWVPRVWTEIPDTLGKQ